MQLKPPPPSLGKFVEEREAGPPCVGEIGKVGRGRSNADLSLTLSLTLTLTLTLPLRLPLPLTRSSGVRTRDGT